MDKTEEGKSSTNGNGYVTPTGNSHPLIDMSSGESSTSSFSRLSSPLGTPTPEHDSISALFTLLAIIVSGRKEWLKNFCLEKDLMDSVDVNVDMDEVLLEFSKNVIEAVKKQHSAALQWGGNEFKEWLKSSVGGNLKHLPAIGSSCQFQLYIDPAIQANWKPLPEPIKSVLEPFINFCLRLPGSKDVMILRLSLCEVLNVYKELESFKAVIFFPSKLAFPVDSNDQAGPNVNKAGSAENYATFFPATNDQVSLKGADKVRPTASEAGSELKEPLIEKTDEERSGCLDCCLL